jgi:ankyrin repeat protein
MKSPGTRIRLLLSVLILIGGLSQGAGGTEESGDRERRSAQLIYNTLHMSPAAGEPSQAQITRYRERGTTSQGVGYRAETIAQEAGKQFVWSFQVAYLSAEGLQAHQDYVAANFAPFRHGEEPESGAIIYLVGNKVWFVLLKGKVLLNMTLEWALRDPEGAVEASLPRWRFFVAEAKRLGILEEAEPEAETALETETGREARPDLDARLLEAAQSGDLEVAEEAIRGGADVNAVDEHGATPLGWAASNGHVDVVRALIGAGADVHWQAERGQSALNVAAAQGQAEIVRLLIAAGADVNERVRSDTAPEYLQGATPLFLAVLHGHLDAVETLLGAGADVDARNRDGSTALFMAAQRGEAAVIRALIHAGATPDIRNSKGATPLLPAAGSDSAETVWLLIEAGADPNTRASDLNPPPYGGMTALMVAAHAGSKRALLALILAGADPRVQNSDGQTAADVAAAQGHQEIVDLLEAPEGGVRAARQAFAEELIDAAMDARWDTVRLLTRFGIDIDATDDEGATALMRAAEQGKPAVAAGLLDAGADVNATDDEFGATALMIAAFYGRDEIVRALIGAGADPNARARGDEEKDEIAGWTALMFAASEGHAAVVSQLLEAGADPELANKAGRTAQELAEADQKRAYEDVIALLKAASGPPAPDVSGPDITWDFETGDLRGWQATGESFAHQPTYGDNPTARGRHMPAKQQGDYWIGTYEKRPRASDPAGQTQGDGPEGTLTSLTFPIEAASISFLIGGGCDEALVRAELLIGGEVVRQTTGRCSETMERRVWDVLEFLGRSANIRLIDESSGGWGHINFDDVRFQ